MWSKTEWKDYLCIHLHHLQLCKLHLLLQTHQRSTIWAWIGPGDTRTPPQHRPAKVFLPLAAEWNCLSSLRPHLQEHRFIAISIIRMSFLIKLFNFLLSKMKTWLKHRLNDFLTVIVLEGLCLEGSLFYWHPGKSPWKWLILSVSHHLRLLIWQYISD